MARTMPDRDRRRKTFLRALLNGEAVAVAAAQADLKWSTLYLWRRDDKAFRAAWDAAAKAGNDALAARFDGALIERAVDGVDEPVFHAGEQVGTRKRYSDPLLMFGIRELRDRRRPGSPDGGPRDVVIPPSGEQRITVVVRQFGPPDVPLPEEEEDGE